MLARGEVSAMAADQRQRFDILRGLVATIAVGSGLRYLSTDVFRL
jgi:hypothetical protein